MKDRNYGIDFLRLLLMYMVCMLHILGKGGVISAFSTESLGYKVFWLIEIICCCAVDGFAIISGYTASKKERKYDRLVNMWFQVFFYSFIITVIFVITGVKSEWRLIEIIQSVLPVTFNYFWYFTAFFALYFVIPILNKFLFDIDTITAKKAIIILFVLFSIMGTFADPFNSGSGYSAIWLMVLYCIGLLAKRTELFKNKSNIFLIGLLIFCIVSSWILKVFLNISILINYVSPTILLSGIIMVILFSRIKFNGKIISKLTPFVFGIYLFQMNEVIWNTYINNSFAFVSSKNVLIGIIYTFIGALIIFVLGLTVEILRKVLAEKLKISRLSSEIVRIFDSVLSKLTVCLK